MSTARGVDTAGHEGEGNPLPPNFATAIVPVYNGATFVRRAIQSIQQQTSGPAAIIVVDDCSTDSTVDVIKAIAEKDSRVRLVCNDVNKGPSYSRNLALQMTSTPVAAFLDADDQWLPYHLEHIARAYQRIPAASVVYARVENHTVPVDGSAPTVPPRTLREPLLHFLDENPIPQSAASVRTEHILKLGGYHEAARYAEDYDLWVRFALANATFAEVPRVTALRTQHGDQVSTNNLSKMYHSAWAIRRRAVQERYGDKLADSADALAAVLRAEARDIAAALHSRKRELVAEVLDDTNWIPALSPSRQRTRDLIGWRWPLWRATAFAYDCLPQGMQGWWRQRRTRRVSAASSS